MTTDHWSPSTPWRRDGDLAPRRAAHAVFGIILVLVLALGGAAPAAAFDTAPHFDMTEDVLASMGFSPPAIRTVQAANFLVDFHEFMRKEVLRAVKVRGMEIPVLDPRCRAQMEPVLKIGDELMHFDSLTSTKEVAERWDAMLMATESAAKKMAAGNDILGLLALLGMSLHNVQDFYAHSNWVEQDVDTRVDNPGIGTGVLAPYGSHPTWLSVSRTVREKLNVHTDHPNGKATREHGDWNTDWDRQPSPVTSLNKDWAGRSYYTDAYRCAYFATIQWTRLFRSYVANTPDAWGKMRSFQLQVSYDPSRDWEYARKISFYGGHWNGNGGPTGAKDLVSQETAATSPVLLVAAARAYMGGLCLTANPSALRIKVVDLLKTWATVPYTVPVDPPNLSKPSPETVTFGVLEVQRLDAIDKDDGYTSDVQKVTPVKVPGAELDWYARIRFGGQSYWSCLIDEHNTFNFVKPYAPWTMIKALPTSPPDEELVSLVVEVRTGTDDRDADEGPGTDDDLFLWLGGSTRALQFPAGEEDFEKGSLKKYSLNLVPKKIDSKEVPKPYRVSDIRGISIRKPQHGKRGAWQLAGLDVTVNGKSIYSKPLNVWLDAVNKEWTAPDFKGMPSPTTSSDVPVFLRLMELDGDDHNKDDHEDVNLLTGAKDLGFLYAPASGQLRGDIKGSGSFKSDGAGDSDRASITVKMSKLEGASK